MRSDSPIARYFSRSVSPLVSVGGSAHLQRPRERAQALVEVAGLQPLSEDISYEKSGFCERVDHLVDKAFDALVPFS